MADEGNGLHDPWAPPERTPSKRRWPGSAKAIVIILVLVLLGTAAGLGYGWWKTNDDKKDLESTSNQQGQELSQQLDKVNQALATTQQALTAANDKVTDLQGKLTSAQNDAAASKKQADALTALFPLDAAKLQPGVPGSYRSGPLSPQTGGCSLPTCPSAQLALSVELSGGGLLVSDPALGRVPLVAARAGWTATGPAAATLQLSCNGSPQATTFTLTLNAGAVALDSKQTPQVTILAGSLVLSSAAVAEPPTAGCPAGVASYVIAADRV